ncbi:WXG100 family type VII secretion target [Christensenellaceae bacterium OttesenSCG-928-M15]|nr:WXG100 family type VII secretion target [Christensenellaceae bacterium OttesenSCG-928-M15]
MASGENIVDIQLFKATADALNPAVKALSNSFAEWQSTVSAARGDWQGATSENIRNTANQLKKSSEDLLRSVASWQATLNKMAGIYDAAEKKAGENARSLKFNKQGVR